MTDNLDCQRGTARLDVVVPVAVISSSTARSSNTRCRSISAIWPTRREKLLALIDGYYLVKYQVTPWIIGPLLAGLLARRYDERAVWSGALLGKVLVPLLLITHPQPVVIKIVALWQGFTGALMWIAGISLVQMVSSRASQEPPTARTSSRNLVSCFATCQFSTRQTQPTCWIRHAAIRVTKRTFDETISEEAF